MAKHSVSLQLPEYEIGNSPVEFPVYSDGKKLGTLLVSSGRIAWRGKGKSSKKHSMDWEVFDKLMREHGWDW